MTCWCGAEDCWGQCARRALADAAQQNEPVQINNYVLLEPLGRGGSSRVWRAVDPTRQNREVALKLLKFDEMPDWLDAVRRLKREFRLLASLDHPCIPKVYDTGVDRRLQCGCARDADDGCRHDRHFIALQLIRGHTLDEYFGRDLPTAADLVRQAALAVHYAHERGVLHRDIKPGNLMVVTVGAQPHVYVIDFGLARTELAGFTASGMLMGTPAYMAPEQVRNPSCIDKRADVYGLGATLYRLLTGRKPFEEADTESVLALVISEEEPKAPRSVNPEIPRALEAIVRKAMCKNPEQRYDSADGLAADLLRWRHGETVTALSWDRRHRLIRAFRKHWTNGLVAVVAILMLALGGVYLSLQYERARSISILAELATSKVNDMLSLRRAGHLTPDIVKARVAEVERHAFEVIRSQPNAPEPHYELGRVYRAAFRHDDALRQQEAAVAKVERAKREFLPSRYERAILKLRLYELRMEDLRAEWRRRHASLAPDPSREDLEDNQAKQWRRDVEEDLARVAGVSDSKEAGGPPLVAKGLLAYLSGRYEEAKQHLSQWTSGASFVEECYEWLGRIAREEADISAARKWYEAGIERDRGYRPFRFGFGMAEYEEGLRRMHDLRDPREHFQHAIGQLALATSLPPDEPSTWQRRAEVAIHLGLWETRARRPAQLHFAQAVADLDRVVHPATGPPSAVLSRALALTSWGVTLRQEGGDPRALYERALADCETASIMQQDDWEYLLRRGDVLANMANELARSGSAAAEYYERALRDYDEALRLDGTIQEVLCHKSLATLNLALHRWSRGEDSATQFRRAKEDSQKALELCAAMETQRKTASLLMKHDAMRVRADATLRLAKALRGQGQETSPLFEEAIADLDVLATAFPMEAWPWTYRGEARLNLASRRRKAGDDSSQLLAAAIEDLTRAIDLDARNILALECRAKAHYQIAKTTREPIESYRAAEADLKRACELDLGNTELRNYLSRVQKTLRSLSPNSDK